MLKAHAIGHYYRPGDWLFRGIDIDLADGEVLAVLGPNARGKTTLLTCLNGVTIPREGTVETNGSVGFVPQNHDTTFSFTVFDIVLLGRATRLRAWSTPGEVDEKAAWKALDTVGISSIAHRIFTGLSGGQQQLVLIARALVSEPGIILLDEPTSALDMKNQTRTLSIISALAHSGMTVVFTTHDPTHALHVANTTMMMGDTVAVGATGDLLREDALSDLYGTPVRTPVVEFPGGARTVVVPDYDG